MIISNQIIMPDVPPDRMPKAIRQPQPDLTIKKMDEMMDEIL